MVMEAMRLSLIEHEEQQRRQKEEEAKKQRAAAEGNEGTAQNADASSSTASDTPAPAPSTGAGASSTMMSLPPIMHESSFSADFLSASSLSGSNSGIISDGASSVLTPSSSQTIEHSPSGRNGHSTSVLDAALRSAASTASAIASPSLSSSSDSTPQVASVTEVPSLPSQPSAQAPTAEDSQVPSDSPAEGAGEGDEADSERSGLPIPQRMASYASSLAPSNYDPLPSSPDSSPSDRPLLEVPSSKMTSDAGSSEAATAS